MKKILFLVMTFLLLPLTTVHSQTNNSTIVVIHSYAEDIPHTSAIREGINEVFDSNHSYTVRHEYMDTKNFFNEEYLDDLKVVFMEKYSEVPVQAVIVSDNNAINFVQKYKDDIFPDTEIFVGTGINLNDSIRNDYPEFMIIEETPKYKENIELIYEMNRDLETVHVIIDNSTTGTSIEKRLMELYDNTELHIEYFKPENPGDLLNYTYELELGKDAILWTVFFRDFSGESFYTYEVLYTLSKVSPVPIYGLWEFYLDHGIVGGYLLSSKELGTKAAETVFNLMDGAEFERFLYIDEQFYTYKLDAIYLNEYNLNVRTGSTVINGQFSDLAENKEVIIGILIIIITLLVIVIFLMRLLQSRMLVTRKNDEIIKLNEQHLNTQKEIISRLGNVIETNSHDTYHHSDNMAKVAAFIGSKFGLDQEQCKILEMITPMHDIGKIAISNEILQKPGKLTDDEYEEVKRHASIGYELFKDSENSLLSQAAEVTLYHHEKWDGSGYPVGLKGDEIPINSQIVGICDIYDALRSVRSYKRSWTVEETVEYFNSNKGTLFQEKLVDILVDNIDEIEKLRH